jgi:formamidopyrimidine-DNA glycosylase
MQGRIVGKARAKGKWLFVTMDPGYVMVVGECGGRVLFHPVGSSAPPKYHLYLGFDDGSSLTATTQMWGAMELYKQGHELNRQYIRDMRPTPVEPEFTFDYFSGLIDELSAEGRRTAKGLLTQQQMIPGLGNAIAQDILYLAKLHPKHLLRDLGRARRQDFHRLILSTVDEVIARGGRTDEYDLYNHPGGYRRIMDSSTAGKPCPECGTLIEKIQYLGGACYFCPHCQR